VRALAKLNSNPLPQLPMLRPLSEVTQLTALGDFSGPAAPSGTPSAVVKRLQRSIAQASTDPAIRDRLGQMGIYAVSSTPHEFKNFVTAETVKRGKVIEESGFKVN
jgi:tripartite-type tricarboxylate transporter receptor subunit TctC